MKRVLLLGTAFCATASVFAAESTERGVSVYDANPHCMERTVDPADPACTLKSAGAPRQFYPANITPVLPEPPVMPQNPPVAREGSRGPTRTGG